MTPEGRDGEAWRSALWGSLLNVTVGLAGALVVGRLSAVLPLWGFVQQAGVGALGLIALLAWRRAPRVISLGVLQLQFASALTISLGGAQARVFAGQTIEVYQALKAGMIVIAILSPSAPVGTAWITIFAMAPVFQPEWWPVAARQHLPSLERWFVPVYGILAAALLLFRRRSALLESELSEARAEQLTVERLARMSLALRDLANTPLQTLSLGVSLLRHKLEKPEVVLDAMGRSIAKLVSIQQTLAPFEDDLEWRPRDESLDAVAQIE